MRTKMNGVKDIAKVLAKEREMNRELAYAIVEQVFAIVMNAVNNGEAVKVSGFGTLKMRTAPARKRRNPKTGEVFDVPEHRVLKLKPWKGEVSGETI